jgi:hypothetical protein
VFGSLDQIIDAPLSQKVGFGLFGGASAAVCRALIHPVHAVDALFAARGLKLTLQLFLGPFLLDLIDALLGPLALGQCLLFRVPYRLLIAPQGRVERLLEVEVAASHLVTDASLRVG